MNTFGAGCQVIAPIFAVPSRLPDENRARCSDAPVAIVSVEGDVMAKASQGVDLDRLTTTRLGAASSVRDLTTGRDGTVPGPSNGRAFGGGRAWLAAALVNITIVLAVALGVVLGPPLLECRRKAEIGFFAGDSFQACVHTATTQRLARLESQLRMMVRGSGR